MRAGAVSTTALGIKMMPARILLLPVAAALAFLLSPHTSFAVPLAEWQPDEDKLLGKEAVTLADLPDEWQGLNGWELSALCDSLNDKQQLLAAQGDYTSALRVSKLQFYAAAI